MFLLNIKYCFVFFSGPLSEKSNRLVEEVKPILTPIKAMASDNAAPSSETSPKRFKAIGFMVVTDVQRLKAEKTKIYSPIFTCTDDPLRTSFKMQLGFGTGEEGKLEVRIIPTSSDVQLFQFSVRMYDDQMEARKIHEGTFPDGVKKVGVHWGWNSLYSLDNDEVLRVMFRQ